MLKSNYLIINKKAQKFAEMKFAGSNAVFVDEEGKVLDFGVLPLDGSVYAMMSCAEVKLLMLVTDRQDEVNVIGVFWKDESDYGAQSPEMGSKAGARIYKRDLKVNSYAWSIAEKLRDGIRISLTDAVDESEMAVCPECGMLNPAGTPYCLDCGCELQ